MEQGLQQAIDVIDSKIDELRRSRELLISIGGGVQTYTPSTFRAAPRSAPAPKRTMSPDARARIAKAQKKRWEDIRNEEKKNASKVPAKRVAKKGASVRHRAPKAPFVVDSIPEVVAEVE